MRGRRSSLPAEFDAEGHALGREVGLAEQGSRLDGKQKREAEKVSGPFKQIVLQVLFRLRVDFKNSIRTVENDPQIVEDVPADQNERLMVGRQRFNDDGSSPRI